MKDVLAHVSRDGKASQGVQKWPPFPGLGQGELGALNGRKSNLLLTLSCVVSEPLFSHFSILLGVYYGWLVISFSSSRSVIDRAGYHIGPFYGAVRELS